MNDMDQAPLKDDHGRWLTGADRSPQMLWTTDAQGNATGFNKTWLEWRGRQLHEEVGSGWLEGLHDGDRMRWTVLLGETVQSQSHVQSHVRLRNARGNHLRVAISGQPWLDGTGDRLSGYLFSAVPEDSNRPLHLLTHSTDLFRATIEALHEGVIVIDAQARFVWVNQAAEVILGLSGVPWAGESLRRLTGSLHVVDEHGRETPTPERPSAVAAATGQPVSDRLYAWHVPELGLRWFSVSSRPLVDPEGAVSAVVTSFLDVTAQKHEADNARHEARHDALTGLVNRWGLRDVARIVMERVPRQGSDVALLYCDLDQFKQVNDSLGHAGGDELLQVVAARIKGAVRSSDIVARIGGDEVVVILDEVHGLQGAMIAAEKVRAAVANPVEIRGKVLLPHLSIGVALLDSFDEFDEALNRADEAMYAAKEAGRNRSMTLDG